METILNKNGSVFIIIREWLDKEYGHELFTHLDEKATWINCQYGRDNKLYKMKREICLLGDGTHQKYPYSKIPFTVNHWDHCLNSEIKKIKDNMINDINISQLLKDDPLEFNSCVVNKYKTGSEYIRYHSDLEAQGPYHQVISLSLGASRTFHIKKNNSFEKEIKTVLNHGDLLLMFGRAQEDYLHAIHSENVQGKRISLTYRYI